MAPEGRRKILSKAPTLIYFCMCIAGFTFQSYQMNDLYFRYSVTSTVNVETPQNISFDAMTLCTRYIDVMDYVVVNRVLNSSFRYSLDDEEIRDLQNTVTAKQIFDLTPDVDHVISSGYYRKPGSYLLQGCHDQECTKSSFDVDKFYYLEYICYRIRLKNPTAMSLRSLTETSVSSGLMIKVLFTKIMSKSLRIVITMHGQSLLPYRSLTITPVIVRGGTKERLAGKPEQFSRFTSYQRRMSVQNLPAPYETNCFNYQKLGFHSDLACIRECVINRTIHEVNRLPFSVILTEGRGDLHVLSYRDTLNKKLMQKVMRIEQDCSQVTCKWSPCSLRLSLTVTTMVSSPTFESEIVTPVKPSFTVNFTPIMDLTEYLVYLMSIFTTWSGLHMIQMDVFDFMHRKSWFVGRSRGYRNEKESAVRRKFGLIEPKAYQELATLSVRLHVMEDQVHWRSGSRAMARKGH